MTSALSKRASITSLEGAQSWLASSRDEVVCEIANELCLSIVILGASGDLARKKTFPALFTLHRKGFLPKNIRIFGYARTHMTTEDLHEKLKPTLKGSEEEILAYLNVIEYVVGQYDEAPGFIELQKKLADRERRYQISPHGRLFYLALPPSVYVEVTRSIQDNCTDMSHCVDTPSWLRLIIEKPFGMDLETSEELADKLGAMFPEEQLYRIDHYLGKEMSQNMLVMRFANNFLRPAWNQEYISNVQITFKEPFGTDGRGGYFDSFGIIRDVIQNHLIQVLALLTMEKPISLNADDVRDEKVKLLRSIKLPTLEDTVLGQYTAGGDQKGYLDDPTVPPGSKTPTFAAIALHIDNDRWKGVPFILKAGKALNERLCIIRVQFKPPVRPLHGPTLNCMRNELVFRYQPDEAIYMKMVVKMPGLDMETTISELNLSYNERYSGIFIPDAYERLILDAIRGDQQHFVRRDELRAAWAIFTPLLHEIDQGLINPIPYPAGSRGPPEADELAERMGFFKNKNYEWKHREVNGD